ncbi:MAG: hypothetical protein IKL82_04410 [Clostridia bacterium]|nr:hypothetical protein [Clostridia bacterium]
MKTTINKKIAVICLSAIMMFGLGFGVANISSVNANSKEIELTQIEEKYAFNSTLLLDDRLTGVAIDGYGNSLVITEGSITYPNGMIYEANDEIGHVLNQVGEYTVSYKFVDSLGKTITVYDTFDVMSEYFYLSNENGSTITASSPENPLGSKEDGISVNLNDGCEFVFNKPIDLNKEGLVDIISFDPEGYDHDLLANSGIYKTNAEFVTVTLTDAYDPSIYVFYRLCVKNQNGYGYIRSGTNSQQDSGLIVNETLTGRWDRVVAYIDGVRHVNHFGSTQGAQSGGSAQRNGIYYLKYDFKNNYTYVSTGVKDILISQLQNPACYTTGVKMFQGFTTGEVFVSLKVENYEGTGYQVDITSVGDMSGTELIKNFNGTNWEENYKDERAPDVYVDVDLTENNSVYCAIGENFVLPTANVYDVNLATDIRVNVYKDYYSDNQRTPITITGGMFNVRDNEVYTVEYSAKDYAGNVGKSYFDVIPVDVSGITSSKALNHIGTLTFETDKLTQIYSGETVTLPAYTLSTYNLDSALKIDITATCKGKTYNIDPETLEFIPSTTGTYQITYAISDNAVSKVLTYSVECVSNGIIRFVEKPFAYRNYLAGFTYELKPLSAYKYVDFATPVASKVYVQYDGEGEWTEVTDIEKFVVSSTATSLQFKYVATEAMPGQDAPYALSDVANVVNVGGGTALIPQNYFIGDVPFNGVVGRNLTYDTVNEGTNVISFVNPIQVGSFNFTFYTYIKSGNVGSISAINIILTDIYNTENKAVFTIYEQNDKYYFITDQTQDGVLLADISLLNTMDKMFTYDHNYRKATYGETEVDYLIDFTTELAYLDIELVDVTGTVTFRPDKLANVVFSSNLTSDKTTSNYYITRDHGNHIIGDSVTIYAPSVADILTPTRYFNYEKCKDNCQCVACKKNPTNYVSLEIINKDTGNHVKVLDENGNEVVCDGIANDPTKDYTLVLNEYATYQVILYVRDVSKQNTTALTKEARDTYNIKVINDKAPVITLGNGIVAESVMNVGIGETFTIPFTVSDDNTLLEDLIVSVMIRHKHRGYLIHTAEPFDYIEVESLSDVVEITDTCAINRKGDYEVRIYAYDSVGNFTLATFTIHVS